MTVNAISWHTFYAGIPGDFLDHYAAFAWQVRRVFAPPMLSTHDPSLQSVSSCCNSTMSVFSVPLLRNLGQEGSGRVRVLAKGESWLAPTEGVELNGR